ncbi:hypothetical protein SK128_004755, partial [Halocaridina rubra]
MDRHGRFEELPPKNDHEKNRHTRIFLLKNCYPQPAQHEDLSPRFTVTIISFNKIHSECLVIIDKPAVKTGCLGEAQHCAKDSREFDLTRKI